MATMQSVGKYQLIRELGKGATGKVYLADDPFAKRKVAVKVAFPQALKADEDSAMYKSMFLNEAALAGKLNHPHIVQIFDAVVEDKYSYIVMEYVEGGTLEKFCKPDALLETREVAEIIFKCVRALAFAQTIGLTHRDIKPGNILHKEGTEIKIADFGATINKVADHTVITNVGSPAYMSPELVAGTVQASHLTDIYALGVVMYFLLTGKLPFAGANTMSVIYQIVNTEPQPPSAVREGLLPEFDAIVMKAISKDPAHRFQSWDEFGTALAQLWKQEAKVEEKRDETESERFQVLRNLPFFAGFPENELWEVIKLSKWAKFKPETSLIKEGDHGDSFFILAGGYVRVTRGKKTLTVLSAGDCFGEMSYLKKGGDDHRSATVTTTSDTIVMKIRADDLKQASQDVKRLFDERFLAILVSRLEAANQQLSVVS